MANSNVNIAEKLFAYIRHGKDITPEIKQVYNNSLIFLGDEQQIYVPVMNTYVGIGMTAYTNTLQTINELEAKVDALSQSLASDKISKVFVDWNWEEAAKYFDGDEPVVRSQDAWAGMFALNNEITFKGVHDYDPATHMSYAYTNKSFVAIGVDGDLETVPSKNAAWSYSQSYLATSGITITPHWGAYVAETNPLTGESITRRYGNWIEIDDKLTWSYMTSAYAYTLGFTQEYTASEIDRLYHNLLGDSEASYIPVSFDSVYKDVTDYVSRLAPAEQADYIARTDVAQVGTGDNAKYYLIDSSKDIFFASYDSAYMNADGVLENGGTKVYTQITAANLEQYIQNDISLSPAAGCDGIIEYAGSSNTPIEHFAQLYVYDEQYNSTYNMNIKDGIETLKEVAYLLDKLTDGHLGSVTYYTYAQVLDNSSEYNTILNGEDASKYENHWISTDPSWAPNANDTYAYLVNVGDPNDLGIQIAYSIAGNKTQIDDLHKHAELLETGDTTLRSIQSTSEHFGDITLLSSKGIDPVSGRPIWANTDTNQGSANFNTEGHPNENTGNSYVVGDVNIKLTLNTAYTYLTVYDDGNVSNTRTFSNVQWIDDYTMADMSKLSDDPTAYYIKNNDNTFTQCTEANFIQDPHKQTAGLQYWYKPDGSEKDEYQNPIYTRITKDDWAATSWNSTLAGTTIVKEQNQQTNVISPTMYRYDAATSEYIEQDPTAADAPSILYFISGHKPNVLHPEVPNENKLATTDWTAAFVETSLSGLNSELDNILGQAMDYTDKRINALDNEYKYSDFHQAYWHSYAVANNLDGLDPSDVTYATAYENEYEAYKQREATDLYYTYNGDTFARLSYVTKSEYIFNVKEENGIVTAESRELPTDTIKTDTLVWGEEKNLEDGRFEYAAITGLDTEDTLLNALYAWEDANGDNQVFVEVAGTTYQMLDPAVALNTQMSDSTDNIKYYLDSSTGEYEVYDAEEFGTANLDYASTNDARWMQLYKKVHLYKELNLDELSVSETFTDGTEPEDNVVSAVINGYTLTKSGGEILVTGGSDDDAAVSGAKLLHIVTPKPEKAVKYLTSESKHFTFEDNGDGGNELSVTAHIVKLEDAEPDNTGFADAYDVKEYIQNLIKFVDISATVSPKTVNSSDKYHKMVTLAYFTQQINDNDELSADEQALYSKSGGQYSLVNDPATAYYWADNNESFTGDVTDTSAIATIAQTPGTLHANMGTDLGGGYIKQEFNATGHTGVDPNTGHAYKFDTADNYYIRIEFPRTNVQNLTETKYR